MINGNNSIRAVLIFQYFIKHCVTNLKLCKHYITTLQQKLTSLLFGCRWSQVANNGTEFVATGISAWQTVRWPHIVASSVNIFPAFFSLNKYCFTWKQAKMQTTNALIRVVQYSCINYRLSKHILLPRTNTWENSQTCLVVTKRCTQVWTVIQVAGIIGTWMEWW